jgi:opacity protein-like surface antigen
MKRMAAVLCFLLAATPAFAQYHKFEVGVGAGYTLSEGVNTGTFTFGGNTYDEVDPTSGFSYGLNFAYLVNRYGEIGFMFNQQKSNLQIGGNIDERDLVDLDINNYHGYAAYNFGMGDAQVQPIFLFGLGATQYLTGDFQGRNVDDETKFSTTWGGGVKIYPSENIGLRVLGQWTPTYIKSDAEGWWCDPFYGCFLYGDADYSHQFEFSGAMLYRF